MPKRAKDALAAIEAMEAPKSAPAAASTPERAAASTPAAEEKLAAQRAASLFGSSTVGEGSERKSLSPTGAEEDHTLSSRRLAARRRSSRRIMARSRATAAGRRTLTMR